MNRITRILILSQFVWLAAAQPSPCQDVPDGMSWQAVVRNAQNELVTNQRIGIRVSIRQGSASGGVVYQETHSVQTNANGLASLVIGQGYAESGSYAAIDWSAGPFFVQTETDVNGGSDYTISSTTQMMTVPFAYYAERAGNAFSGDYADLDNVPADLVRTGDLAPVATSGDYADLSGTPDLDSYITTDQLSDVAQSGRYEDIEGAPTKVSELANDAGYLTSKSIELTYDNALGLGFVGGQNYVTLPIPSNVSQLANDAAYLDRETLKDNIAVTVSQPDEDGHVAIQLSDGKEAFGEQQLVKLPTAVSELDNDAGYLKEVDITIGLKDNTLTLTNATNEATSSVTLPSRLSEFENDEQFLRLDEMEFRIEDNSVLVLRRNDGSIVASVRLPEQQEAGTQLPDGTSAGDILYWGNNAWNVLPAGLEGQVLTFQSGGLAWSNPTVFDEQDLYQPGDIFVNSSGVTEGIVVSTDPMTRTGLLLALNDITSNWSNVNELIGADDPDNGLNNMAVVKAQNNWNADYPAFELTNNLGEQWYIPSFEEMRSVIADITDFNEKLSQNSGSPMEADYYATSTEYNSLNAYGVSAKTLELAGGGLITGSESTIDMESIVGGEGDEVTFHYDLTPGDTIFTDKDAKINFRPVRRLSWSELNSKPIEGVTYNIGDVYYASDGQTPLGIVFEVSDDKRSGKMVSLEEFEEYWCTIEDDTANEGEEGEESGGDEEESGDAEPAIKRIGMDSENGAENMAILAMSEGYNAADYPAINKCAETTPWYMPSYREMRNLMEKFDAVQSALQSLGDKATELQRDISYATSNEIPDSDTTIYGVSSSEIGSIPGTYEVNASPLEKTGKYPVRAIREF